MMPHQANDPAVQRFSLEFLAFKKMAERSGRNIQVPQEEVYPCLNDRSGDSHVDYQYSYHLGWAARILAASPPARHVDISSFTMFSIVLSAFFPVEFYDYRPMQVELPNLKCGAADLCALPFEDESIASLSCMHVIEHIGLGRYGDALDPDGDLKAARQLQRVLKPGGQLLMVAPTGRPRVRFNAHRIFGYTDILAMFSDLELKSFAFISDDNRFYTGPDAMARALTGNESCGCYQFVKKA